MLFFYKPLGKLELAIADFDRAIELDPEYARAYYDRGSAYDARGEMARAIAEYERAQELDPGMADNNSALCLSHALNLRAHEAMPSCNKAIAADSNPYFYDTRGLVYAQLGDYDAAIQDLQHFVDALSEQDDPELAAMIEQRQGWIKMLQKSVNPFTPAVLENWR